jgi:hypothetical protein
MPTPAAAAAAKAAAKAGAARKLLPLGLVFVLLVVGGPLAFIFTVSSFFGEVERQSAQSCVGTVAAPNAKASEIPDDLLRTYMAAGQRFGVDWRLLAGIGSVETDHGRNLAVSSAGALGWMQFMPDTWDAYGVDANGDGKRDSWDMADAVFGAANYIKALLDQEHGDVRGAIFGYNHASWYVDEVLQAARAYGYGSKNADATTPQAATGQYDTDAADDIADRRQGRVAYAVADQSGAIVAAYKPNQQFHSASITKAMLLVAALQDGEPSDALRADLGAMIRDSDNDAANRVFARVGKQAVLAVADQAQTRNFDLDTGDPLYVLGDSLVTAADQARFFSQILDLIPQGRRDFARGLLASVTARWGIVQAAGDTQVLSKAGWRDEADDDSSTVVQAAQLQAPSGPVAIAVMTDGDPSIAYGQQTIAQIATSLLNQSGLDTTASGCGGIEGGGPQAIRQAADQLEAMHIGYAYGGGHVQPAQPNPGLDCSSSISWVLQHAGYDVPTMTTEGFIDWAQPGRGADGVTLWNKPYGPDAHIIIQVGDRFFGTSGFGHPSKGDGPAWFDQAPSAEYLAGFQPTHIPASAMPKAAGDVKLVGDSLAEGIEDRLPAALDGMAVSSNARTGRPLAEGMNIIRGLDHKPGVLAVSLFTNDDPGHVSELVDAVHDSTRYVAQGGCVVWATIVRPPVGGTSYDRANNRLRSLASAQVIVVDWADEVRQHPGWIGPDGVHPTPAGYDQRARLYAEGIRQCAAR